MINIGPEMITANAMLMWFAQGLCFGAGFSLALYLIGVPFRRWVP